MASIEEIHSDTPQFQSLSVDLVFSRFKCSEIDNLNLSVIGDPITGLDIKAFILARNIYYPILPSNASAFRYLQSPIVTSSE